MESINENHSNNPIVIVLLLILLGIGGYFMFNKNTQNNTGVNKQNYYMEHGDFSMSFPKQPTFSTINQELYKGHSVTAYNYHDIGSDYVLSAAYVSSAFSNSTLTPKENLKKELLYTSNTEGFNGVVSSNLTTYQGLQAIDYLMYNTNTQIYFLGRDIIKGNDLYELGYSFALGNEDKQLENTFLNSLTFSSSVQNSIAQDSSVSNFTQGEIDSLKQQLKAMQNNKINTPPQNNLPSVIHKWSPSVALIACRFADNSFDFGSGFLTQFPDNSIVVITNKHVITDQAGYAATQCAIEIPGDGNNTYTVNGSDTKISSLEYDWGILPVSNGDTYFTNVAEKDLPICQTKAQTGNNVIVLGYPDYAGNFAQPTATQGIVSGYADPYYTTSAKIEAGNSGGVALDPDRDCYIGIPSAVQIGKYDNLGRVLNANVVFQLNY